MNKVKTYYRNNLPHHLPIGATFFVTFRLADSLPKAVLQDLAVKFNRIQSSSDSKSIDREAAKLKMAKYYMEFDEQLDKSKQGEIRLDTPELAAIISTKLHEFDNKYYTLIAYSIMPNHVHLILDFSCQVSDKNSLICNQIPANYKQLHEVMKLIKGGTAFTVNKLSGRFGQLWASESYDRVVRDLEERANVIRYILNNPVKAGLVSKWEDWPYSFLQKS